MRRLTLALGLLACALAGCAEEGQPEVIEPSSDYISPNGDERIPCEMTAELARCLVKVKSWDPPATAPKCDPGTFTALRITPDATEPSFECWEGPEAGETIEAIASGQPTDFAKNDEFVCTPLYYGMGCRRVDDEVGFSISPRDYGLHPGGGFRVPE